MHPETKKITQKHALSNTDRKSKATTKPWFSRRNGSILGRTHTRLLTCTYLLAADPHGAILHNNDMASYRSQLLLSEIKPNTMCSKIGLVTCVRCVQGYYMQRKGISLEKSSVALTLLSLSELVTYVLASFLGNNLKGRLIYANVVSSSCLAVICIAWPFVDVHYVLILVVSIGHLLLAFYRRQHKYI